MKIGKYDKRGEGFPFGLWNKDEIEHRETLTANTTTDHQNRSRGVTFEKQEENCLQFLSYDHVTNGLALIMKDKAETKENLLQMKARKNYQKMTHDQRFTKLMENFLRSVLKGNTLFRKEGVIYMAFIFFLRHQKKEYLIHTLNEDFQLLKLLCLNFGEKAEDTSKAENRNLSIWIKPQIDVSRCAREAVTIEMFILAMALLKPKPSKAVKSQDYRF